MDKWLDTSEYLRLFKSGVLPVHSCPPVKPKPGQLFIYDNVEKSEDWRSDQYRWISKAFRDEGGFDNNSMFSSPAQQTGKASKPKCLASVTIKQILECPEEGIKIRDKEVQMVQIIGIVKSVDVTSVKIKYVVADFTGMIAGFLYLDNDADSSSPVVENTYCVVTGSVRSQGGAKHIMIFSISAITDFNHIVEHMLSVVYMPLKLDSLGNLPEDKVMKQEMMSSYGGTVDSDLGSDVDPRYKRVYDVITKAMSDNGMNISEIRSALPTKLPDDQIRAALDYLVGEGHIYTTIDENHYRSVNSAY